MARNSVLSSSQIENISIENFVYHIIKSTEQEPVYLSGVKLATDRQRDFFKRIISQTGTGTQYTIINRQQSVLADKINDIHEDPDQNFLPNSEFLAASFLSHHSGGNTSDGVFIISRVKIPVEGDQYPLLALIKLDYSPVMKQSFSNDGTNQATLEEILDALSEHEGAVQKRALIDVGNHFSWDVLAIERGKTGQKMDSEDATSDYFRRYLGIILKESNSTISKQLVKHCYAWARSYLEQGGNLDDSSPQEIRLKSVALLEAHENGTLNYDQIKNEICRHSDPSQAEAMTQSFDEYMFDVNLQGVSFSPKPSSVDSGDKKGEWKLDGVITVSWKGQLSNDVLTKEQQKDGSYIVTIKATDLVEV